MIVALGVGRCGVGGLVVGGAGSNNSDQKSENENLNSVNDEE